MLETCFLEQFKENIFFIACWGWGLTEPRWQLRGNGPPSSGSRQAGDSAPKRPAFSPEPPECVHWKAKLELSSHSHHCMFE